jgi:anti-sigma factor RsiW
MASWAPIPHAAAFLVTPDRCPANASEIADLYALGRLTPDQESAFEDHYLVCPKCAHAVQLAQDFIAAMRLTVGPFQAD